MKIVGHRGARGEAPENTVESFIVAQENGCTAFELDIQLSRDLELMVFHDSTLERTTGQRGALSSEDANELLSLSAAFGFPRRSGPCPIPTLRNVIENCPHCTDWQFEVKADSWFKSMLIARALGTLIQNEGLEEHARCVVTSSSKRFLTLYKKMYPNLKTGLVVEYDGKSAVGECLRLGVDLLVINRKLTTAELCQDAHSKGLEVSVWTVNDTDEMKTMAEMGVDSLITDFPSLALKHF